MSSSPGRRETAKRLFAAEFDDATFEYSESDEERAPNYVVTPTGARVNRLFFVGVLTEVEQVGDDILRARIVDPTGAFVVYAGQYQPEEMAFLDKANPPAFVAVTGKARTFSPDDSDRIYTSVRPESITEVDSDDRDRWTVTTAEHTLGRVVTFATALETGQTGNALEATLAANGVDDSLASGIPLAMEEYGTTEHYLSTMADLALDVLRVVTDEKEEVDKHSVTTSDAGDGTVDRETLASVTDLGVESLDVEPTTAPASVDAESAASDIHAESAGVESTPETAEPDAMGEPETVTETGGESETVTEAASGSEPAAEPEADSEPEPETASDDDIGDFEPGSPLDDAEPTDTASESADTEASEAPTATEDALDDEERERIEEEFGTDFQSGAEVGEAGEAGIEPEAGEPVEASESDADDDTAVTEEAGEAAGSDASDASESADVDAEPEPEAPEAESDSGAEEAEPEPDAEEAASADDPTEDVDLESAVVDTMSELDDGDGADREELIAAIVDAHGVDPSEVEDAIQDALMGGKCYEPADGKLKPI